MSLLFAIVTAMTIIQTPDLRSALQAIQKDVDNRSRDARRLIGAESVRKLRSTSVSRVNVDTGKMRRSFFFKVARGNNRIDIINTARSPSGFRYPVLIERRYGGAARTLRAERTSIARRTQRALDRGRVPTRLTGEKR